MAERHIWKLFEVCFPFLSLAATSTSIQLLARTALNSGLLSSAPSNGSHRRRSLPNLEEFSSKEVD